MYMQCIYVSGIILERGFILVKESKRQGREGKRWREMERDVMSKIVYDWL